MGSLNPGHESTLGKVNAMRQVLGITAAILLFSCPGFSPSCATSTSGRWFDIDGISRLEVGVSTIKDAERELGGQPVSRTRMPGLGTLLDWRYIGSETHLHVTVLFNEGGVFEEILLDSRMN